MSRSPRMSRKATSARSKPNIGKLTDDLRSKTVKALKADATDKGYYRLHLLKKEGLVKLLVDHAQGNVNQEFLISEKQVVSPRKAKSPPRKREPKKKRLTKREQNDLNQRLSDAINSAGGPDFFRREFDTTFDEVESFLNQGANVNAVDDRDRTVLLNAVSGGHERITKLLLDRGADVDGKGYENQQTPLIEATMGESDEIVKLLLDRGANIKAEYEGETALVKAVRANRGIDMIRLLLDGGSDVNAAEGYPLVVESQYGNNDIVKLLLDRGADIWANDALRAAAYKNHPDTMELLLSYGADFDTLDYNYKKKYAHLQ